jgi:hypothetical protein
MQVQHLSITTGSGEIGTRLHNQVWGEKIVRKEEKLMFIFTRQVFTLDKYACMENKRKAVNTMYGQRKTNSGDPLTKIIFGEKKEKG